ncbi:MAG: hypothetical protein IKY22_04580 [Bacteroidales bacterium]|nr:hypothetical protein [Bacteroidales bacterium]
MKQKIITLLIMLLPIASFAQEKLYSIKGCVVEKYSEGKLEAAPFLNVTLTDTTDKIRIGGSHTDFDGMYYIDSIPEGRYMLTVRSVGAENYDTVLTINSDCNVDTVKIYNRWYNINGNRIWERQVKIGFPDYSDLYREIYMDYRMAIKGLNKTIDKKIGKLPKGYDALKRIKVDTMLTHLKGVSMKTGYILDVFYKGGGGAGMAHFYCRKADERKHRKNPPSKECENVLDYMNVEFTPEGIWSAFQLEVSNRYLFKFWHAYYSESWLVFSKDEAISSFYVGRNKVGQELINKLEELTPIKNKVEIISDSTAELTAYFWNDWMGLMEEKVQVQRKGTSVKFIFTQEEYRLTDMTGTVLVPYDCGIMF